MSALLWSKEYFNERIQVAEHSHNEGIVSALKERKRNE